MINTNTAALEAQDKFRRSYLDAMKSMATVAAYSFAANFLYNRQYDHGWQYVVGFIAGLILTAVAVIGAITAMDLFWIAVLTRFPGIAKRKTVFTVFAVVVAVIALAPAYVSYFRGG